MTGGRLTARDIPRELTGPTFFLVRAWNVAAAAQKFRTGEMIPEVEGTRPWGPRAKGVPKCLKGPKTTYTTIAVAEKQSKRSKKGPFLLHIGSPPVPPRK